MSNRTEIPEDIAALLSHEQVTVLLAMYAERDDLARALEEARSEIDAVTRERDAARVFLKKAEQSADALRLRVEKLEAAFATISKLSSGSWAAGIAGAALAEDIND